MRTELLSTGPPVARACGLPCRHSCRLRPHYGPALRQRSPGGHHKCGGAQQKERSRLGHGRRGRPETQISNRTGRRAGPRGQRRPIRSPGSPRAAPHSEERIVTVDGFSKRTASTNFAPGRIVVCERIDCRSLRRRYQCSFGSSLCINVSLQTRVAPGSTPMPRISSPCFRMLNTMFS